MYINDSKLLLVNHSAALEPKCSSCCLLYAQAWSLASNQCTNEQYVKYSHIPATAYIIILYPDTDIDIMLAVVSFVFRSNHITLGLQMFLWLCQNTAAKMECGVSFLGYYIYMITYTSMSAYVLHTTLRRVDNTTDSGDDTQRNLTSDGFYQEDAIRLLNGFPQILPAIAAMFLIDDQGYKVRNLAKLVTYTCM